jgi:hypothetical protein
MWILTNVYVPCTPEGKKLWIGSKTSICLTMLIGLFLMILTSIETQQIETSLKVIT